MSRAPDPAARTRRAQALALLLTAIVLVIVALAVFTGASTSDLAPGKPVPGAAQTLALFAGIPQHGPLLGFSTAPLTLVELGDLQCPACSEFAQQTLPEIVARYVRTGRLRLRFEALTSIGPDSLRAARMAVALGEQGRLWELVELIYRNQGAENTSYVTDRYLSALAEAIPGVDLARALRERDSAAVEAQISLARAQARAFGVQSTPSFLLYGPHTPPRRLSPADLSSESLDRALAGAVPSR
jgi:protein-disulfide isomerase